MMRFLGHLFLIAVSGIVSWWFLLRVPEGVSRPPLPKPQAELTLTLSPVTAPEEEAAVPPPAPAPESEPKPAPEPEKTEAVDEPPAPPPPETGEPEGEPDPAAKAARELAEIEDSPDLMKRATEEVRGESRKGFRTTFLCSARDQLAIARYFREPVVLVPRAGLRPGREHYHRLVLGGEPKIEKVRGPAPLTQYRQYRDLFAFSYESLPAPLRELRRRVFVRSDVYLFAALIPPREWGLVIARRDAALADYNRRRTGAPRTHDDVRGFTMRYVRLPGDAFDIRVDKIRFADGTTWRVDT